MSNGFSRCVKFSFVPLRFRIPINRIHLTAYQMQVTKGDCVGALEKLSGSKKSKRRSKEERKAMVEAFLKRHQASNSGTFPSLQLTHKEVGGSYYVVREIFQELIKKNRVLVPPKLPAGEENRDGLVNEYGWNLDKDDLVNGSSDVTMENEEIVEAKHMDLVKGRVLEGDKDDLVSGSSDVAMENEEFVEGKRMELVNGRVLEGDKDDGNSNAVVDTKLEEKLLTSLQESTDEKQTADATPISSDSCEAAASKKSVSQETNPIVSFMKTVAAYVKFWS